MRDEWRKESLYGTESDRWRRERLYKINEVREDIIRWMEKGKTVWDEWWRGRLYEMDVGGKDIMRWMKERKTVQSQEEYYEMDGGHQKIVGSLKNSLNSLIFP